MTETTEHFLRKELRVMEEAYLRAIRGWAKSSKEVQSLTEEVEGLKTWIRNKVKSRE